MFKIKYLSISLYLFSALFAYTSLCFPLLNTDEEILAFLLQVRKKIPKLFLDAVRYDTDLFRLLENQAQLVTDLKKDPEFENLHSRKKYVNISMQPIGDIWVGQIEVKPEAIEAWKHDIVKKIEKAQSDSLKPQNLLTVIDIKDIMSSDPLNVLNKIGIVEGKGRAKTEQIKKFKAQNNILETCKKENSQLKEKFLCISQQYDALKELPNMPPKEKIEAIIRGLSHEERVLPQLYLAAVLNKNPDTVPQNWDEFKNSIAQLNSEDLIHLNDRDDVLKPTLVTYFDGENDPRLVRAVQLIHKEIHHYASQTISHQTKVTSMVELIQVPPEMGIFRGFIGGDCSSQLSFPYPNDPHERVFYIKSKKSGADVEEEKFKGYLSATEVMVGGEKALYVITISGAHVSAGDVELIFRGLEKAKETLGVKHIILPGLNNIANLINFPAIQGVYENYIRKSNRSVELVYQDQDIRQKIEQYKARSEYNSASYDYSSNNTHGMVLSIKNSQVSYKITERLASQSNSYLLDSLSLKEDLFEFIKELKISGRKKIIDRVLKTKTIKIAFGEDGPAKISSLILVLDSLTEHRALNVEEFKTGISVRLINLGLGEDYLDRNPHLMVPGYFRCKDAFSQINLEQAAMLAANDIKIDQDESLVFPLIQEHLATLNRTSAFNKLNSRYFEKLSNPDAETRKTAIKIFSKTRPADPKIHMELVAKASNDPDLNIRDNAWSALREIKPTDQEVLLQIATTLLGHEDGNIRVQAASLLGQIKTADPATLQALAKALSDPNAVVREEVARTLKLVHPTDQVVLLEITALLRHENTPIGKAAADVLSEIMPTDQVVLLEITALLGHENWLIRERAADVLNLIRSYAGPEIRKALAKALNHLDIDIRRYSAEFLLKNDFKDPEIQKSVLRVLGESLSLDKVAYSLKLVKPANKEDILEIAAFFLKADLEIRLYVAQVLTLIGAGFGPSKDEYSENLAILDALGLILDDLVKLFKAYRETNRWLTPHIAIILSLNKCADFEIEMELARTLIDTRVDLQDGASCALLMAQPQNTWVISYLAQLMMHDNQRVRSLAALVLCESNPPLFAKDLINLIEQVKKHLGRKGGIPKFFLRHKYY